MTERPAVEIRRLRDLDELRACERLQRLAWEMDSDLDVVPVTQLVATEKAGGILLGAFDDGELVGFCYGFLGRHDGRLLHWSHMTAVESAYRDAGVGAALKWAQRNRALEQGLDLMAWTYDPLESRNAYFNFSKLGIVARSYWRDVYGETGSPLHRGIPTDRFLARWHLSSPRVRARARGDRSRLAERLAVDPDLPFVLRAHRSGALPRPSRVAELEAPRHLCEIPGDIQAVKSADLELAGAWRQVTRELFTRAFEAGYRVRECVRTREPRPRTCYLLEREDSDPAALSD